MEGDWCKFSVLWLICVYCGLENDCFYFLLICIVLCMFCLIYIIFIDLKLLIVKGRCVCMIIIFKMMCWDCIILGVCGYVSVIGCEGEVKEEEV